MNSYLIEINLWYIFIPIIFTLGIVLLLYIICKLETLPTLHEKLPSENTEEGKSLLEILNSNINWKIYTPIKDGIVYKDLVIRLYVSPYLYGSYSNKNNKLSTSWPYLCAVGCTLNNNTINLNRKDQVDIFNLALSIFNKLDAEEKRKSCMTVALKEFQRTNIPPKRYIDAFNDQAFSIYN